MLLHRTNIILDTPKGNEVNIMQILEGKKQQMNEPKGNKVNIMQELSTKFL